MTSKQRRALDRMFRDARGSSPSGSPRFRWMETTELSYFMHDIQTKTAGGIFFGVPQDKWTRCSWAAQLGRVWVIAQWVPPDCSETQWILRYGQAVPYPAQGRYCPIMGSELPPGMEPNEEITALAVNRIVTQEDKPYDVHLREIKEESERDQAEVHKQFAEELDEWWGIDGHTPGMKDSTAIWTEPLTKQPSQPQNA